ncbi:PD-(D/E)XK nuclease family protein [Flavobacterium sp. MAH-1]|uniref:PD-(D/E)XK nuclease family protein n=1 Tax=Flavobacterium agri TaxID=2743471 RepID=A0A7Y8Y2F4_9FLAO|nr:PD-(D/E)XK nuclease family protein [Flavobacterium agri]NUY81330.1 PD-(D/E)XK nuclease family protein [Flavobacterium agri]NYA71354.1 PD-(D/E)XK nuclease family protein [Flavobacterium agri]
MTDFLDKLAQKIIAKGSDSLVNLTIVLPNRRARIFLIEAIRKQIPGTVFSPRITSIEDFIQEVALVRTIDNIELLFAFYEIYLSVTDKEEQQDFELFANWAKVLLQDFNEIDRYLLDPFQVLNYLKAIEDIKHWSLDLEKRTPLIENYLKFWNKLPEYYTALTDYLSSKGVGYQGFIYREAVKNLEHFTTSKPDQHYIFAGFNALNAAEEVIIQHLLSLAMAEVYWDIDSVFLKDEEHDAGLFIRRFKNNWKYYNSHPFEWIMDDFGREKTIKVIGTPKTIGQAKIAGKILEEHIAANPEQKLDKTAVVLGEENLLVPLLYGLPSTVGALNITMGYSARNNPAQILVAKLFKLHVNAKSRHETNYVFYYKDVLDILTHPLIEPYANARETVNLINRNNYSFITQARLLERSGETSDLFRLLFTKWDQGPLQALLQISDILLIIKTRLGNDNQQEKIAKAFLYSVFKVINKLISYFSKDSVTDSIETLQAIYKQVIDLAEVSFEGEPLEGLQIMGVLESRVLDFDTVIVTSMNEGNFPAGKSSNSFIPYDVKREFGLPTFKEKDAIYTYHFYHLLQRAKTVYLLYNTESEGLDAGERSRFITQLEVEKQPKHHLSFEIRNAEVPLIAYEPIEIPKSPLVMDRLKEIADKGFSPSSLTSYIRNPADFYFKRILRISEIDEVEETIALNTLGTIIHATLENLYRPLIGKFLLEQDIDNCFKSLDAEVMKQFKEVYKEGDIKKGRNLLAFEVAKRNVANFLRLERDDIRNGDAISIIALEHTYERWLEHSKLPYPVLIKGNVDRVEMRNGKIRIVDYKTGKVEAREVKLKDWDGLITEVKTDKIIQVLAYAFMISDEDFIQGRDIEAGIISFKNLKNGFLPFEFQGEDKVAVSIVNEQIFSDYTEQLASLLSEILDPETAFVERINR